MELCIPITQSTEHEIETALSAPQLSPQNDNSATESSHIQTAEMEQLSAKV